MKRMKTVRFQLIGFFKHRELRKYKKLVCLLEQSVQKNPILRLPRGIGKEKARQYQNWNYF